MLFAADRIPIVVDVTAQMLSPAIQNELDTISYDPGNTSDVIAGEHELPDLSDIDLPEKYEDLSRDEILDDIMANGGNKTDDRISNQDWLKLLIALGVITIGESQMDNDNNDATSGNTAGSNNGFDINNNLNPNTDLVSDFQNQNMCTPGFAPNGRGNITAFESPDPFGSSLAPAAGPIVVGGAEIAAGGAILGGAACAANEYCPEAIGNILTSAGEGVQNAVEGMLGIFSSDDEIVSWEGDDYHSHPSKAEEQEALSTLSNSSDCAQLSWSIDVIVRQMKFRRWDAQRSGNAGYADHKKFYDNTLKPTLKVLVTRADAIGCPYNPEAKNEINRSFNYKTPYY